MVAAVVEADVSQSYHNAPIELRGWRRKVNLDALARCGAGGLLADLIRAIEESVAHPNRHAEPFIWTATAATILRKVRHRQHA